MNLRTRGRWLAARLRKLERAYAAMPQTAGQISSDDEDASGVVTSRPGQLVETMCKETEEGCLPEEISGAVAAADQGARFIKAAKRRRNSARLEPEGGTLGQRPNRPTRDKP